MTRSATLPSIAGNAWSPSGDEAWFTASLGGTRYDMMAVRPGGPVRQIAPAPASVIVEDVRRDGRTLLQTIYLRMRVLVKTPANTDEQDLSWFDYGLLSDMSADGSTILFSEQGEGGGPNSSAFVATSRTCRISPFANASTTKNTPRFRQRAPSASRSTRAGRRST
jgi:Tol biopolymer transport system component